MLAQIRRAVHMEKADIRVTDPVAQVLLPGPMKCAHETSDLRGC